MPAFRRLPLGQLTLYCPPLPQVVTAEERAAWRELQRRALVEQNPTAWDALMMRLWPGVLAWIYARAPELAPTRAEQVAQQVISEFRRRQSHGPTASAPTHAALLADLQQLVELRLADAP